MRRLFAPPPPFRFVEYEALGIYDWIGWILRVGFVAVVVISLFIVALGWRRGSRPFLWTALVGTILAALPAIYSPMWAFRVSRMDRVRGAIVGRCGPCRVVIAALVIVVIGHAVLIAVAGTSHTPPLTRRVAQASAVVTCVVLFHLIWLVIFQHPREEWWPRDWMESTDRFRPMRACRGALLWELRRDSTPYPVGDIDDLWLRFDDPRVSAPVRAVSLRGRFENGYLWLSEAEARTLRVHADDPALRHCDGTWRRDPVTPAPWHSLGWPPPRGRRRG